jgi:hypothetical protein
MAEEKKGLLDLFQSSVDYTNNVMKRLRESVQPVSRPVTIGGKEIPSSYDENSDVDYLKYKYFFLSVSFDKTICELVLNPKSVDIKREILNMNLAELMINAKAKEFMIMSKLNDFNQPEKV